MSEPATAPDVTLSTRVRAAWRTKLCVTALLTAVYCIGYFGTQRVLLVAPRAAWATAVDDAVAFDPRWVWVYLSVYVMLPLPALLLDTRAALRRYTRGFAGMGIAAFVVFAAMPITAPRPAAAANLPAPGLYHVMLSLDRPLNCLPSLHIAMTVYTLLLAGRVTRVGFAASVRAATLAALCLWGAAVAYSTLATKQHWFVDIPAGAALGVVAHVLTWRGEVADAVGQSVRADPFAVIDE